MKEGVPCYFLLSPFFASCPFYSSHAFHFVLVFTVFFSASDSFNLIFSGYFYFFISLFLSLALVFVLSHFLPYPSFLIVFISLSFHCFFICS